MRSAPSRSTASRRSSRTPRAGRAERRPRPGRTADLHGRATPSLDFGNQAPVLREVRALAAQGYGIVLSTHDPDHAFACATTVALLHQGRLAAHGPPAEVLTAARLESVYGVRVFIEHLASGHTVCAPDLGAT